MKKSLIDHFISKKRYESYNNIDEYTDNLCFSKNSYIPLSILEISLRNSIDKYLSQRVAIDWYEKDFLTRDSKEKIFQVKNLLRKRKEPLKKEKIIAELSLGFWVNLFKKPYEEKLRINDLKKIFPNLPSIEEKLINREVLYKELNHIRNFRNRIFHYEKVLNKDNYNNVLDEIFEIISYFDLELCEYVKEINEK